MSRACSNWPAGSVTAQDRREAASFLRDKRQAAYAQFLVDEQAARQAESDYLGLQNNDPDRDGEPPPPTPERMAAVLQLSKDNFQKLTQSAATVALVGSDEAHTLSTRICNAHQFVQASINPVGMESPGTHEFDPNNRAQLDKVQNFLLSEFIDEARRDLAAGDSSSPVGQASHGPNAKGAC